MENEGLRVSLGCSTEAQRVHLGSMGELVELKSLHAFVIGKVLYFKDCRMLRKKMEKWHSE